MAPLIRFDDISLSFGEQKILSGAELAIEPGERVCLIGRNGAGKSTTLRLITGELEPDEGTIERPGSLRLSLLDQKLADGSAQTVRDFVALGMTSQLRRIARFEALSSGTAPDGAVLRELEALEREIIAGGGWSVDSQIDAAISQLHLPAAQRMDELSGGWRRRVALAQALVSRPEILLLDEPTNHLDITTIEWLERELARYQGALLFVTHDRSFVEHVATRIIDIDRGKLRSWPGRYSEYLERKAEAAELEDRQNALFDKKLAGEEAWIRQGVKARTTRNEGRVRALEELREIRAQRIKRPRTARIAINEASELSGRKVIEAHNVSLSLGGRPLIRDFSLKIMRGERIGIVGNNGVGKSTLLRVLTGELAPDAGEVRLGTNLAIGYFDQLRREIDPSKTVAEFIGEGREYITIRGARKHVVAYLTDFLFSAKRALTPIAALSGGERNRVLLAKLFTRPVNLLVLDEPTNDLDVETLEALEARLAEFDGTLIVASHDRHFLDAVVTATLVFEADGAIRKHAGGYTDWASRHRALAVMDDPEALRAERREREREREERRGTPPRKLSYKLQRELDGLPDAIAGLEQQVAELHAVTGAGDFYRRPQEEVRTTLETLKSLEQALEAAVERWAELEQQAQSF